eukprot:454714-Pyramimonas_sp.AAC.1
MTSSWSRKVTATTATTAAETATMATATATMATATATTAAAGAGVTRGRRTGSTLRPHARLRRSCPAPPKKSSGR